MKLKSSKSFLTMEISTTPSAFLRFLIRARTNGTSRVRFLRGKYCYIVISPRDLSRDFRLGLTVVSTKFRNNPHGNISNHFGFMFHFILCYISFFLSPVSSLFFSFVPYFIICIYHSFVKQYSVHPHTLAI